MINETAKISSTNKLRYKHSEKGEAKRVAYEASEESKVKDRIRDKRYRESEKGKVTKAAYRAKPEVKTRKRLLTMPRKRQRMKNEQGGLAVQLVFEIGRIFQGISGQAILVGI